MKVGDWLEIPDISGKICLLEIMSNEHVYCGRKSRLVRFVHESIVDDTLFFELYVDRMQTYGKFLTEEEKTLRMLVMR